MDSPDPDLDIPFEKHDASWFRERVQDLANRLRDGEIGYAYVPSAKGTGGLTAMGYVHYDDWLWYGIWAGIYLLNDRLGADFETHYGDVMMPGHPPIGMLGLDELASWFTVFGNRERIWEGLIAQGVNDGTVKAMADRCLELVPAEPPLATTPAAPTPDEPSWRLSLGDIWRAAGIEPQDALAIRHTYRPDGLGTRETVTPNAILAFTRVQWVKQSKIPNDPPKWWFIFMAESGRRCRLAAVYENRGLALHSANQNLRIFDLAPAQLMAELQEQLVVEWSTDTINWAKPGPSATAFPVTEIADREAVRFPSFDKVVVDYATLQLVMNDPRYAAWRVALGSVKGIYLIADTHDGKLYVGKADGTEGVLGRWREYASNGHGDNAAMVALAKLDPSHPQRYQFSLLQVFSPTAPPAEILAAEEHFKRALLSRAFGMNEN